MLLAEPHITPADVIGLRELARLLALTEALDDAIEHGGAVNRRSGTVRAVIDLRLRASRRLQEMLDRLALTPKARADFARQLGGATLADEIRRRLGAGQ